MLDGIIGFNVFISIIIDLKHKDYSKPSLSLPAAPLATSITNISSMD